MSDYNLFLPYYINQERLLDIDSILNGGYTEYSELSNSLSENNGKDIKGKASFFSGFRVFKVGADVESSFDKSEEKQVGKTKRIVQTATSMLSNVHFQLSSRELLTPISEAKVGSFICEKVNLKINSAKDIMDQQAEMLKFVESIPGYSSKADKKQISDYSKLLKSMISVFPGEEIVDDRKDYAIFGTINENHLYQASKADIIDVELTCLGQVKRIYANGTTLMKNSIFSRINDAATKKSVIEFANSLSLDGFYNFDSVAIAEIKGKPVYQIEIIALYQEASEMKGTNNE